MPPLNRFRHQTYPTRPVITPVVCHLPQEQVDPVHLERYARALQLEHILLVHGTVMGDDPFGVAGILGSLLERAPKAVQIALGPALPKLTAQTKRFTDRVSGGVANYDETFCETFRQLLGGNIAVRRMEPTWSSENHHLARAALGAEGRRGALVLGPGRGRAVDAGGGEGPVTQRLAEIDLNTLTPIAAIGLLAELKTLSEEGL